MLLTPDSLPIFNFSLTNQSDGVIDVHIDGDIVDAPTQELYREFWGDETSVSFRSFRNQIDAAKPKTVNLYVNSGGGHVGDAMAMHDYLVELEGKGVTVNRTGRGIVASAATYLLVGNNSTLTENSWFMIHNVSGAIRGDVNVIENYAKTMRKFNNAIRDFYSNVTGLEKEQVSALMNKETWMTAAEAKDKGFVKNVTGAATFTNAIKPEHWQYTNRSVLNAYNSFTNTNPGQMDMKKLNETIQNGFNALLDKLGIKDKATDENVKNALSEFSTNISNAIKDAGTPDDDSVKKLVNEAVAEALKNIAENEGIKNAIAEATKNTVTKKDLTDAVDSLTNAITQKLGGKSKSGGEGGEGGKNKGERKGPKNRFSGAEFWPE